MLIEGEEDLRTPPSDGAAGADESSQVTSYAVPVVARKSASGTSTEPPPVEEVVRLNGPQSWLRRLIVQPTRLVKAMLRTAMLTCTSVHG